jgi:hypothetical protein
MRKFNGGKSYHGSRAVQDGGLCGSTDTDHFYFFCPRCPDNYMLRVLDYGIHAEEATNPYNEVVGRPKAARGFILVFKLHCQKCGFSDFTKIGNMGWQGGTQQQASKSAKMNRKGADTQ